jgi:hypothetical protein
MRDDAAYPKVARDAVGFKWDELECWQGISLSNSCYYFTLEANR